MYYITKYALTQGIIEAKDEDTEMSGDGKYLYLGRIQFMGTQCVPGEFFRTLEEAKFKVDQMIEAKRRSVEKQLKKLESLSTNIKIIPYVREDHFA